MFTTIIVPIDVGAGGERALRSPEPSTHSATSRSSG